MKKGLFIVLDSGEGSGKSTQLKLLQEKLGDKLVVTREPGGTPYAEEIRKLILHSPNAGQADAKTMFGLFWAARADHLKNLIKPSLEAGKIVVCDRFDSSTYAYQIVAQGASELEGFFWQMRDFYLGSLKPDLYIYLDIKPEVGLARKSGQDASEQTHFEAREIEFHKKLRVGYKAFLEKVPHAIVDAGQSVDMVQNDLLLALYEHLGLSL